jgi:hypothetical protein
MKEKKHFVKPIDYSNEHWLTDFIFGQKGSKFHGHLTASGAIIWYLRDEAGREIVKDGRQTAEN